MELFCVLLSEWNFKVHIHRGLQNVNMIVCIFTVESRILMCSTRCSLRRLSEESLLWASKNDTIFLHLFFFFSHSLVVNYEAIWNVLSCTKKKGSRCAVVEGEIFSLIKIATFSLCFSLLYSLKIQSDSLCLEAWKSFQNFFCEFSSFLLPQKPTRGSMLGTRDEKKSILCYKSTSYTFISYQKTRSLGALHTINE